MRQQLGVAMGAELMAMRFKFGLAFGIVEEFAVEDDGDVAVFVVDRLPAIGEADDAEPAQRHAHARPQEEAVFVRAAVVQGLGHSLQHGWLDGLRSVQVDDPCDTAHGFPR